MAEDEQVHIIDLTQASPHDRTRVVLKMAAGLVEQYRRDLEEKKEAVREFLDIVGEIVRHEELDHEDRVLFSVELGELRKVFPY